MTEILGALAIGLSIGFFTAFFWQERRVRELTQERDRAIDRTNLIAGRRPVTSVVRAEQAAEEQRVKEFAEKQPAMFGEAFMNEVGDEPTRTDDKRPAGVDLPSIQGR